MHIARFAVDPGVIPMRSTACYGEGVEASPAVHHARQTPKLPTR